jgi:hypothetical protein
MIEGNTGGLKIAEVQFRLLSSLDRRLHVLELVTHPNYICSLVIDRKGCLRAEDLLLANTFRSTFDPG